MAAAASASTISPWSPTTSLTDTDRPASAHLRAGAFNSESTGLVRWDQRFKKAVSVVDTYLVARWTRTQVEQFAPDEKSVKAALKLARPAPWSDTGSTDTLVWGKCQGSGKTPYQVSVDLTGPAAKCTCPSRKFPCKHGIALLMLWVDGDGAIAEASEAADFASDWADGRADRAAKKQAKTDAPAEPVDPVAAAKRLEKRVLLMTAGAAEFETWLTDLYRNGFAASRQQAYSFWEAPAARLLDSQLPGLAQRVRDIPARLHGDDWADVLLTETGRMYAAVRAWQRRDQLDEADLANLRVFLGWSVASDEVRAGDAVTDTWIVQGLHRTDDGRLKSQRTWLRGATSGQLAVLLDFAAGGAFLESGHVVGSAVSAPLSFYPGSGIRRALFADGPTATAADVPANLMTPLTITDAMSEVAAQIAINPFVDEHPVCLAANVTIIDDVPAVVDVDGSMLPLVADYEPWNLLARVGATAVPVFGEVTDGRFRPLTVELDGELVPV